MLKLGEIRNARGAHKEVKRLGRGSGSGRGQTAGKGSKGQLQRTGGKVRRGFEGGQMPLYRRLPKRGFTNIFAIQTGVVNLEVLERFSGTEVSLETLKAAGLVRGKAKRLKVLGNGNLTRSLRILADAISTSAKSKVEAAGGTVELVLK